MDPRIKEIIQNQRLCVLATSSQEEPHCSLMGYLWEPETGEFYMVTSSESKKFRNLEKNPKVSLLLDTRTAGSSRQGSPIRALTVQGRAQVVSSPQLEEEVRKRMLETQPHLAPVLNDPKAMVLCIRPSSFLLLDGVEEAHFEELKQIMF